MGELIGGMIGEYSLGQLTMAALGFVGTTLLAFFEEKVRGGIRKGLLFLWNNIALFFAAVTKAEIGRSFKSKRHAEEQMAQEISKSSFVFAWIGRGNYLQREIMEHLDQTDRYKRVRVLLPDPQPVADGGPDWTAINEQELAKVDTLYGDGHLRAQLKRTAEDLKTYSRKGLLEYRTVNFPHLGRLIITDRNAYYTPYDDRKPSSFNRTIAFRKGDGTVMYDNYLRMFNLLWDNRKPLQDDRA